MLKMIVAVDENCGIGYQNELLFHIKEDLQRFRALTTGHYILMGRKTFESLPKTLPNRKHIVLTRDNTYKVNDYKVDVVNDLNKLLNHYLQTGYQEKDIWVIGGAEIYDLMIEYVDEIYLTRVDKAADKVDAYFNVKKMQELNFKCCKCEKLYSEVEGCYVSFKVYKKVNG